MFEATRIRAILVDKLPECRAIVDGDDGVHFQAEVCSPAFVGKTRVQQHQLVYAALGDHMKADIHALQLKTYVPETWPHR